MKDFNYKCHIELGAFCTNGTSIKDMSQEFIKAYIEYMDLTHPTLALDSNKVLVITNKKYVDAKASISNNPTTKKFDLYLFIGIAIGAVAILAILLYVIYTKRKGITDDDLEVDETEQ